MRRQRAAGMVGRAEEADEARAAVARVAAASGHALLITGEAGIGKTRLVQSVADAATDRFRVITEAASELETELPFAPLVRALELRAEASDPRAAALGTLLADPGATDPQLVRLRVIEGIGDLVEQWALERPVLLAVEDLHWADDATLQALDRLGRRLQHIGVLLVGTARPHPRPAALQVLERTFAQIGATTVDVSPLSEEVMLQLARDVLSAEPGPQLTQALRQAGGNPLYVTELLEAADAQLDRRNGVAELPAPGVPESVRLAIVRNLASLPAPTLDVLRTASVLGTRFDLRQLALTLDRTEPAVIDHLGPAFASGVVAEAGDRVAFRHDLVRDTIYEDQPLAARAAWHRRVVERLHAAGAPTEDLVPHLLRGQWRGAPEAVEWLAEAGRAMRGRSLPVAVDLLTRALEQADDDTHLRLDLAEALAAANRAEDAAGTVQPVLDIAPHNLTEELRDRLVLFAGPLTSTGSATAAHQLLDALEAAGLSSEGQGRAAAFRAWLHWAAGRRDEAEELAMRALEIATDAGDHAAAGMLAQHILARITEMSGAFEQTVAHMRASLRHARLVPAQPELQLATSASLAMVLGSDPSAHAEADRVVAEALALADQTGQESWQSYLEAIAAINAQRRGAWPDAAVRYEAALSSYRSEVFAPWAWAQIYARAAILDVHRDELTLAAARVGMADELLTKARAAGQETDELSLVHIAEAELKLAVGDPESAVDAIRTLTTFIDARGIPVYHAIQLPVCSAILLRARHPEEARSAVERAEHYLLTEPTQDANLHSLVRWGRARVDGDAGALDDLIAWTDEPRPLWEWRPRIREDAAAVLAATGERDRAVQRLQEALALWEGAGAHRDVARVRQALRDLGVRRGRGLTADRPDTGWASLTAMERRVVALVGEGLIYREIAERLFVSRRTVETHVQHVFRKLDVSSRRELTVLLDSQDQ